MYTGASANGSGGATSAAGVAARFDTRPASFAGKISVAYGDSKTRVAGLVLPRIAVSRLVPISGTPREVSTVLAAGLNESSAPEPVRERARRSLDAPIPRLSG